MEKVITATGRLGQYYTEAYITSTARTLPEVYAKSSASKEEAYMNCRRICEALDGTNFKIIGHTSQLFTVAFLIGLDIYVITKTKHYRVKDALVFNRYNFENYLRVQFESEYTMYTDSKLAAAAAGLTLEAYRQIRDNYNKMMRAFRDTFDKVYNEFNV